MIDIFCIDFIIYIETEIELDLKKTDVLDGTVYRIESLYVSECRL